MESRSKLVLVFLAQPTFAWLAHPLLPGGQRCAALARSRAHGDLHQLLGPSPPAAAAAAEEEEGEEAAAAAAEADADDGQGDDQNAVERRSLAEHDAAARAALEPSSRAAQFQRRAERVGALSPKDTDFLRADATEAAWQERLRREWNREDGVALDAALDGSPALEPAGPPRESAAPEARRDWRMEEFNEGLRLEQSWREKAYTWWLDLIEVPLSTGSNYLFEEGEDDSVGWPSTRFDGTAWDREEAPPRGQLRLVGDGAGGPRRPSPGYRSAGYGAGRGVGVDGEMDSRARAYEWRDREAQGRWGRPPVREYNEWRGGSGRWAGDESRGWEGGRGDARGFEGSRHFEAEPDTSGFGDGRQWERAHEVERLSGRGAAGRHRRRRGLRRWLGQRYLWPWRLLRRGDRRDRCAEGSRKEGRREAEASYGADDRGSGGGRAAAVARGGGRSAREAHIESRLESLQGRIGARVEELGRRAQELTELGAEMTRELRRQIDEVEAGDVSASFFLLERQAAAPVAPPAPAASASAAEAPRSSAATPATSGAPRDAERRVRELRARCSELRDQRASAWAASDDAEARLDEVQAARRILRRQGLGGLRRLVEEGEVSRSLRDYLGRML